MEEIKVSGTKKVTGREMDSETLKALFPGLELPEWMVLKGEGGAFKWTIPESGQWGMLYETAGEREALRGLRLVDELSEVKSKLMI